MRDSVEEMAREWLREVIGDDHDIFVDNLVALLRKVVDETREECVKVGVHGHTRCVQLDAERERALRIVEEVYREYGAKSIDDEDLAHGAETACREIKRRLEESDG